MAKNVTFADFVQVLEYVKLVESDDEITVRKVRFTLIPLSWSEFKGAFAF